MIKHLSLLTLVFLLSTNSQAKKNPGFYINKDGDTVYVKFNVAVSLFRQEAKIDRIQEKIRFYDSLNNTHYLKPEHASEVVIISSEDTIRMLSRANNLGLGSFLSRNGIFLRLIKDGKLKLFKYYESKSSAPGYNHSTNTMSGGYTYETQCYVLQKDNEPLFRTMNPVSFGNDMANYLSECPELVIKIEQKQYQKNDVPLIVDEYNKKCR